MPHVDLGQFRMYYEGAGEGESLVFLHGFTLDRRQYRPQVEFFRDTHHVITPDAKGHGLSDAPLSGYSRADRVEDLAKLVDTLKIERFHLVGLSMGGSTALGYGLAHPERLRSLTLVSSGAAGYGVSKKITKLDRIAREEGVETALATWKRWSLSWYKGDLKKLGEQLETMMDDFSGATWRDPMRGKYPREDDLSRLGEIKVPTAIFAGALDKVFAELAEKLHAGIESSRLKIYENIGHMINLEIPDRFNADLKVFLEGASRS